MDANDDEDARHKKEEMERKLKRKAQKASKSEAQKEKVRKGQEYRQNILKQQGAGGGPQPPSSKKQKVAEPSSTEGVSEFQKLFEQRAQGFQVEFRFRNAPPRPPVGPCFVGQTLDAVVTQHAQHYRALNTVEIHHRWRLHNESDLGVPLAPSAMDVKSYTTTTNNKKNGGTTTTIPPMHPDDEALLVWKGPWGDTAAEELKLRQDRARAAARAIAAGRAAPTLPLKAPAAPSSTGATSTAAAGAPKADNKKSFSRVLKSDGKVLPTFMKKTTYLSNDYSRKVHDFKSLAQTKQQMEKELEIKHQEMTKRRSKTAIAKSFDTINSTAPVHPTNKALKPKRIYSVLPNVEFWGMPFTHLVIDKKPKLPEKYMITDLRKGLVANVEKPDPNAHMTCDLFAPSRQPATKDNDDDNDDNSNKEDDSTKGQPKELYQAIQSYDLDVIPLKDEHAPHVHFCFVLDSQSGIASYIPMASRIQLSTGRPAKLVTRNIYRRSETHQEQTEREERAADVDNDLAEKHGLNDDDDDDDRGIMTTKQRKPPPPAASSSAKLKSNDDGEDDFGDDDDDDDDSGDEAVFGGAGGTIVADH